MDDDVIRKAEKILENKGSGLSVRFQNILEDNGFYVERSQDYIDGVSSEEREIDLLAYKHTDRSKNLAVFFVIECKNKDKEGTPWVFEFEEKKDSEIVNFSQIIKNQIGGEIQIDDDLYNIHLKKFRYFDKQALRAAGVYSEGNQKEPTYDSVRKVSKALTYFKKEKNKINGKIIAYIPVVFFNGSFVLKHSNQDNLKLTPDNVLLNKSNLLIDFVQEKNAHSYINQVVDEFQDNFKPIIEEHLWHIGKNNKKSVGFQKFR